MAHGVSEIIAENIYEHPGHFSKYVHIHTCLFYSTAFSGTIVCKQKVIWAWETLLKAYIFPSFCPSFLP